MGQTKIGITPLNKGVMVDIYDDGAMPLKFSSGGSLMMLDDSALNSVHGRDGHTKHKGIRPRWGIVLAIGDEAEDRTALKLGDKVLMDTNKWTPGFVYDETRKKVWWIKHEDILLVDEDGPTKEEREYIASRNQGSQA